MTGQLKIKFKSDDVTFTLKSRTYSAVELQAVQIPYEMFSNT